MSLQGRRRRQGFVDVNAYGKNSLFHFTPGSKPELSQPELDPLILVVDSNHPSYGLWPPIMFSTTSILLITSFLIVFTQCVYVEDFANKVPALATSRGRSTHSDVWPTDFKLSAPSFPGSAQIPEELQLLDIVVVASIDGKLHGLNRKTGRVLWSMKGAPETSTNVTSPHSFDSLVRTEHSAHDPDRELFIIEPQSGDIYILPPMAAPTEPLQRLPMSIQQLVEMSPFSFPGDEERVFVGRKETSMMVVELETGRVKGTVNSETECFWDDQPEVKERDEIDLDELDGTKPPKQKLK
ncbi:hypothetical protein M422DRAFT_270830, partial [Sphaerobolus stellatus SS14]